MVTLNFLQDGESGSIMQPLSHGHIILWCKFWSEKVIET